MTYRRRVDGSQRGERAIFVSKASSGPMVGVNGTTSIVGVVSARVGVVGVSAREIERARGDAASRGGDASRTDALDRRARSISSIRDVILRSNASHTARWYSNPTLSGEPSSRASRGARRRAFAATPRDTVAEDADEDVAATTALRNFAVSIS